MKRAREWHEQGLPRVAPQAPPPGQSFSGAEHDVGLFVPGPAMRFIDRIASELSRRCAGRSV